MLKKRNINWVIAATLLVAVTGIVADQLGLPVTTQAHACATGGAGGGGC